MISIQNKASITLSMTSDIVELWSIKHVLYGIYEAVYNNNTMITTFHMLLNLLVGVIISLGIFSTYYISFSFLLTRDITNFFFRSLATYSTKTPALATV